MGCVYSVEKLNDVYVMDDAGTLIVPDTLSTLSLIVDTLDMLYKIKQHNEKLATILEPAIERSKLSRQLNKLRSAAEVEEDDTTNPIFFTPTTSVPYLNITLYIIKSITVFSLHLYLLKDKCSWCFVTSKNNSFLGFRFLFLDTH